MYRPFMLCALSAVAVTAGATVSAADAAPTAGVSTPKVVNALITHTAAGHRAPYTVVLATDGRLTAVRDTENVVRLPGDALVNGGRRLNVIGGAPIEQAPAGHRSGHGRFCYTASGLYRDGQLTVGRDYRIDVTVGEGVNARNYTARRKLKSRSVIDAARALGC